LFIDAERGLSRSGGFFGWGSFDVTGLGRGDREKVHEILGPAWKELMSGDKVEDDGAFAAFSKRAAEGSRLERADATTSILHVGKDDWPFPIAIAKGADGRWFLDTESGKGEILARRIGENEMNTIDVCRAYVVAQRAYAEKDLDGSGLLKYSQRFISSPGKEDGLYWPVESGGEQSPLAGVVARAAGEGYATPTEQSHEPYLGYRYRILKKQGAAAPGGKYDYRINGNLVGGFGLIAYPAEYGSSGIMTFIVNQSGKVYQKDLGGDTVQVARKIMEYDPDGSWSLVGD
jgi:hypothetical protein